MPIARSISLSGGRRSGRDGIMTKIPTKKPKAKPSPIDPATLELNPNAWPKFEGLVKRAAKMGHKPHEIKKRRKK